ncbi:hypothetical protein HDU98_001466 [Podochytrium sp. JEL0797]|nr:hypothetical protein HDU98_001466 [Podochytrium sp. JEL0797]
MYPPPPLLPPQTPQQQLQQNGAGGFVAAFLPTPPAPASHRPQQPHMSVNTQPQQQQPPPPSTLHHRPTAQGGVVSPTAMTSPYAYAMMFPPPLIHPQQQQPWLFGGTGGGGGGEAGMGAGMWNRKNSRRGKKKKGGGVGSGAGGSVPVMNGGGRALSLDAVPFLPSSVPVPPEEEKAGGGGGVEKERGEEDASVVGCDGSVVVVGEEEEGKPPRDVVVTVPVAGKAAVPAALLSPTNRRVHPLPPRPVGNVAGLGKRKEKKDVVVVEARVEEPLRSSVGEAQVQVSCDDGPVAVASNDKESTPAPAPAPAPVLPAAPKKVIKAVSVTRSNVGVPAGPFARLGDLYSFVQAHVSGASAEVEEAVSQAFGFSRKGGKEGPWEVVMSRLGTQVFAIGTASSDNRRHLLIPATEFPTLHKLVVDAVRREHPTFSFPPFYVAPSPAPPPLPSRSEPPVSKIPVEPLAPRSYATAAKSAPAKPLVAVAAPAAVRVTRHSVSAVPPAYTTTTPESRDPPSTDIVVFTDVMGIRIECGDDYLAVAKALEKHRKEMKRVEKDLSESEAMRRRLEEARRRVGCAREEGTVFLSLDVEAYERDQSKLIEIGWTLYNPSRYGATLLAKHFVLEENQHLANGQYVPDVRHAFRFGDTEVESLEYVVQLLKLDVDGGGDGGGGGVVVVGHAVAGDIAWLKQCGVELGVDSESPRDEKEEEEKGKGKEVAAAVREEERGGPVVVFDTAELDCAMHGRLKAQRFSVQRMCEALGCMDDEAARDAPFHNAGNDAYLTMQAFLKMAASTSG